MVYFQAHILGWLHWTFENALRGTVAFIVLWLLGDWLTATAKQLDWISVETTVSYPGWLTTILICMAISLIGDAIQMLTPTIIKNENA